MATYRIEFDGIAPVTNPDGSITLPVTPPVPPTYSLSFFGNRGTPGLMPIPNGRAGDTVVQVNVLAGGSIGTDMSNSYSSTLDADGKIDQLVDMTGSTFTLIALLQHNS